jgi:type III secretion protein T
MGPLGLVESVFANMDEYMAPILLAVPRLLGLHMALPMFGQAVVPKRVRSSLVLSMSVFLLPMIVTQPFPANNFIGYGLITFKEFFLGFAFGFPVALLSWAAHSAGDLITHQSGGSMASYYDSSLQDESTPMGSLFMRFAEAIFFLSGTYAFLLGTLFESYKFWPIGSYFPQLSLNGAYYFADSMGHFFQSACLMAFPALTCMFLITFCLGLVGRYIPSLHVFFIAMPLQALAAIIVTAFCIPIYAHLMKGHNGEINAILDTLKVIFGAA